MADHLKNGMSVEHNERTSLAILIVKHMLIVTDKIKIEGDSILGMTDGELSFSYMRLDNDDNAC